MWECEENTEYGKKISLYVVVKRTYSCHSSEPIYVIVEPHFFFCPRRMMGNSGEI